MEPPQQNELEKFIHAQLQKLPQREAPEALVRNVMAAIAARKNLPWWKQPFTCWPRAVQCLLFVTLGSILGAVLYGAGRAAALVSVPNVSEGLSSVRWIATMFSSLGEAAFITLGALSIQWLLAIALVFALLYAACLAAGFALFKVTAATRTA